MNNIYKKVFLFLLTIVLWNGVAWSQVNYNDGPIHLRVWIHKVWSSANCADFGDQEYRIKDIQARVSNTNGGYINSPTSGGAGLNVSFWGSENRYYDMTQLHSADVPFGVFLDANGYKLLDVNYPSTQVPSQFDVYLGSAFENDCYGDALSCGQGSESNYDGCCCLFGVCALKDDYLYNGTGWTTVNFRPGPEGQVNYTQPVVYNGSGDENAYSIVYAYEWDWSSPQKTLCASPNYKDGPITLTADMIGVFADVDWDGGTCGISFGGDEDLRLKMLAKDNLTGAFGNFPVNSSMHVSQDVPKWNNVFLNLLTKNYTTADINMQSFDIAGDMWEEDSYDYGSVFGFGINCGSDNDYEGSDYAFPWLCINGDDAHYVSRTGPPGNPVFTIPNGSINWRNSPPNTFNTIDIPVRISSSAYQNWLLRVRYKWTIQPPTVSIQTADLQGCIGIPISLTATTMYSTYFKWQYADVTTASAGTCPVGATWTDVPGEYCSTINFPQVAGTRIYRCIVYNRGGSGSTTSSGPKYDSAVSNCVRVTYFPYAPPIISTSCGRSVPSGGTILFSVPVPPAANAIANSSVIYNWSISPTSNVSPTSGTGTTFSPTFTSAAAGTVYTVTLTVTDACSGADATSTCTFTVTTPSCDQIYVAPSANGGNDVNPGTASSPYATVANALANIGGTRVHIHIMGGVTYNETQWTIPTNAIVDGGWEIISLANNDWRKNSSLTTTINLNPGIENDGSQGFYRGVVSSGNNWLMQDLTLNVKNGGNQPSTVFNNKGCTIYGIYSNGTSGWEIKRTTINTGNGTNGGNGITPGGGASRGGAGGGATGGGGGGQGSLVGCYGGGSSNCPGGGCQGEALNGGSGTNGASNNGSAGSGGSGGSWRTGGDCNLVGCGANGDNGTDGTRAPNYGEGGGPGIGGPDYPAGNRPGTPGISIPYYQPSGISGSGGNGGGGGKGGGGGGGDVGTCCLSCPFAGCGWSRPNGGDGGNGGGGGLGGGGGYGGGGSFGAYFVNSNGTINQSNIFAGGGGSGGNGASGEPGGFGQGGNSGTYSGGCDGNGSGGNGGKGGDGAPGGRGQDGANGLAQNVVITPGGVAQNGGTPNAPSAAIDYLKARYLKGCTNSYIEIEKGAGSPSPGFDTSAMTASVINDQSPNTTSYSYTATGSYVTYVQFYTPGWKQEKLIGQNGWTTFIRILESRSVPKLTTAPKRVCSAENVTFSITANNPNQDYSNTAADYEWRYRVYKDGNVRRFPVPAWTPTATGAGPNTIAVPNFTCDSITVLIAARVKDKCCGWSIWVYDSIVVYPDINQATAWTSTPPSGTNICLKGAPATLSVDIPTGNSGGITCGPGSSYFIYRYSTDGGVSWTAWSQTQPTAIPKIVGTTLVESAYLTPNAPANCDTVNSSKTITWTINDSVQASAGVIDVAACGTPNSSAIISAAAPSTGSGVWTQVSGASNSTPPTPTSSLSLTINNVPFNTTNNIYRWTVTNGACTDQVDVSIATPSIVANAITLQSDVCYVCPIADGQTYSFYDYSGKIIATIKDNSPPTSALGSTEICTHIHPFVQETWTSGLSAMQPYLQRYWTISPALNTDATITLYFTLSEFLALQVKAMNGPYAFSSVTDLRVSKFPGGGGGAFTPIHSPGGIMLPGLGTGLPNPVFATWAGNGSDFQVTFDCNSFSTFYIHPVAYPYEVLPVELISFTGTNIGDKNKLEWITASELNTDKFIVEKSLDVENWFYVGENPAAGNSSQRLTYELYDNFPVAGNNYYRLKTIDKDGTFKYSQIINIPITATNVSGIVGAYPNPTSGDVVLVISSASAQTANVRVFDMLGKMVKTVNLDLAQGINKPNINLSNLASATYIVVLTDKKGNEFKYKIVKQQ